MIVIIIIMDISGALSQMSIRHLQTNAEDVIFPVKPE